MGDDSGGREKEEPAVPEPSEADLPPKQIPALEALLTGASVTDAAEQAGVDRTTVSRWKNQDPNFMAALNAGTAELRDEMERRMDHLTRSAVDTVAEAIENGDVVTARQFLRGRGLLDRDPPPTGPTDPELLAMKKMLDRVYARETERALRSRLEGEDVDPTAVIAVVREVLLMVLKENGGDTSNLEQLDGMSGHLAALPGPDELADPSAGEVTDEDGDA